MTSSDRESLERAIRERHATSKFADAAELAIRGYGGEIYGFLRAFHSSDDEAGEVFSIFAERLWRALPGFAWECTFRTWAYAIARNASVNHRQHLRVRARVHAPWPETSTISGLIAEIRSDTASYLETGVQSRIAKLRDSLSQDDRMLLSLRIDRGLAWADLARILEQEPHATASADDLRRQSAKLRKRFQVVKERLAHLARKEGLLGDR